MGDRIKIDVFEMVQLKEQGYTYRKLEEHFRSRGINVSIGTIDNKIREYYKSRGIERKKVEKIELNIEEILKLKEQGLTFEEIAKYLERIGIKVSTTTIRRRVKEYYQSHEKTPVKKERKYEDELKEILMSGMNIQEYISEFREEKELEDIETKLKKLRVVAEYAEKQNGEWIPDNNFIGVIDTILNSEEADKKYTCILAAYTPNGLCPKGEIGKIREDIFKDNTDFMTYMLLRLKVQYHKGYDVRVFNIIKREYEKKIDQYLERLQAIEKGRSEERIERDVGDNLRVEEER